MKLEVGKCYEWVCTCPIDGFEIGDTWFSRGIESVGVGDLQVDWVHQGQTEFVKFSLVSPSTPTHPFNWKITIVPEDRFNIYWNLATEHKYR